MYISNLHITSSHVELHFEILCDVTICADNLRAMGIKVRYGKINIELMLRKMNFLFAIEKWVSIIMTCHVICIRIHLDIILYNIIHNTRAAKAGSV